MLRIELVRSLIGNTARNRKTVASLGLRRMHQVVYHEDNATIRGMVHKVKHMLTVAEVDASEAKPKAKSPTRKAEPKPKAAKPKAAAAKAAPKAASKAEPKAEGTKPKAETKAKAQKPKAASKETKQ